MSAGSVINKVFMNKYLMSYFAVSSATEMMTSGIGTGLDMAQDAAHNDPNKFERAGMGAGAAIGAGAALGMMDLPFLVHGIRTSGALHDEAYSHGISRHTGRANLYKQSGGTMTHLGGSSVDDAMAKTIRKTGTAGVIGRNGNFIKNFGWKFQVGSMLGPMAVGFAASTLLGFGGKMMDEMYQDGRRNREMKYDNRYIVDQQKDMDTMQQVGAGMNAYQNRMVSMGRIYHSR